MSLGATPPAGASAHAAVLPPARPARRRRPLGEEVLPNTATPKYTERKRSMSLALGEIKFPSGTAVFLDTIPIGVEVNGSTHTILDFYSASKGHSGSSFTHHLKLGCLSNGNVSLKHLSNAASTYSSALSAQFGFAFTERIALRFTHFAPCPTKSVASLPFLF